MATTRLLPLLVLLGILIVSATARPCKNLFFFSTVSYYPADQNPSLNPYRNPSLLLNAHNPSNSNGPRYFTFYFSEFRDFEAKSYLRSRKYPISFDRFNSVSDVERPRLPLRFRPSVTRSVRDRTKDIMSVIGALLFGVGCGAFTASTMYLIWSLVSPHHFDFGDSDDCFDDGGDVSANKKGYVAIPSGDDAVKPTQAKDVV